MKALNLLGFLKPFIQNRLGKAQVIAFICSHTRRWGRPLPHLLQIPPFTSSRAEVQALVGRVGLWSFFLGILDHPSWGPASYSPKKVNQWNKKIILREHEDNGLWEAMKNTPPPPHQRPISFLRLLGGWKGPGMQPCVQKKMVGKRSL